jgi:hypothetical protein
VNSTEFLRRYPEFAAAGAALIVAAIAEASGRIAGESFPSTTKSAAVGYYAAHLLWSSPFGVTMRLDGAGEELTSPYLGEFERLRLERVPRIVVL